MLSTSEMELKTKQDLRSIPEAATAQFLPAMCNQLRSPLARIAEHMVAVSASDRSVVSVLDSADGKAISPKARSQILKYLESQRNIMKTMEACVQHQSMIINDMMDCSKLEKGQLKLHDAVVDPSTILSQALNILNAQINSKNLRVMVNGKNLDVWLVSQVAFCERQEQLIGDKVRLLQVMLNLLNNAIKFTPKQGEIRIAFQINNVNKEAATLHFSIEDNGIGMTGAQIKSLFHDILAYCQ